MIIGLPGIYQDKNQEFPFTEPDLPFPFLMLNCWSLLELHPSLFYILSSVIQVINNCYNRVYCIFMTEIPCCANMLSQPLDFTFVLYIFKCSSLTKYFYFVSIPTEKKYCLNDTFHSEQIFLQCFKFHCFLPCAAEVLINSSKQIF